MTINEHKDYNDDLPETFDLELIDPEFHHVWEFMKVSYYAAVQRQDADSMEIIRDVMRCISAAVVVKEQETTNEIL